MLLQPPCTDHAWIPDPWSLDVEVCLYCEERRDEVDRFCEAVAEAPPLPPPRTRTLSGLGDLHR